MECDVEPLPSHVFPLKEMLLPRLPIPNIDRLMQEPILIEPSILASLPKRAMPRNETFDPIAIVAKHDNWQLAVLTTDLTEKEDPIEIAV
jgi:hypothetical protein